MSDTEKIIDGVPVKRKRGRPRKNPLPVEPQPWIAPDEPEELAVPEAKDMHDIELVCHNCYNKFGWTVGEQLFMQRLADEGKLDKWMPDGTIIKGKLKPPKYCNPCRMVWRHSKMQRDNRRYD